MPEILGHAPLLLGLLLNNQNNNNPAGAGTVVVVHEHIVEVDYLRGKLTMSELHDFSFSFNLSHCCCCSGKKISLSMLTIGCALSIIYLHHSLCYSFNSIA